MLNISNVYILHSGYTVWDFISTVFRFHCLMNKIINKKNDVIIIECYTSYQIKLLLIVIKQMRFMFHALLKDQSINQINPLRPETPFDAFW